MPRQVELRDGAGQRPHAEGQLCAPEYPLPRGIPFLTDGQARVLASEEGAPTLTMHRFGRGMGLYFASFEKTNANTRLLLNLILAAGHEDLSACWLTDNAETECAYYPGSRRLIVVNNSDAPQRTTVRTPAAPSRWSSLRSR